MKFSNRQSANLIEVYGVVLDTRDWSNLAESVSVIGMEGTVVLAHLLNTREWYKSDIVIVMKPVAMAKYGISNSFPILILAF